MSIATCQRFLLHKLNYFHFYGFTHWSVSVQISAVNRRLMDSFLMYTQSQYTALCTSSSTDLSLLSWCWSLLKVESNCYAGLIWLASAHNRFFILPFLRSIHWKNHYTITNNIQQLFKMSQMEVRYFSVQLSLQTDAALKIGLVKLLRLTWTPYIISLAYQYIPMLALHLL